MSEEKRMEINGSIWQKSSSPKEKRARPKVYVCGGKGGGRLAQVNKGWPENYHGDETDRQGKHRE